MGKNRYKFLATIAFLAGFCFLILEVCWFRIMSLTGGTTITASTLVISSFMLGLGLGALICSRIPKMSNNPLKTLGIILLILSIYAFFSKNLFFALSSISISSSILNFIISFILLFIPSFGMGALIPSLTKAAVTNKNEVNKGIGLIYSLETAGSTVGSLISSFILIRFLGQHLTIIVASSLLLIISIVLLVKSKKSTNNLTLSNNDNLNDNIVDNKSKKQYRNIALTSVFLSGLTISALQIIWQRFFRTYMVNTSYTFSLIAAMVIVGLFIGSRIFTSKYSNKEPNIKTIFILFFWMFISLVIGLILLMNIHKWLLIPLGALNAIHGVRIYLIPFIVSLLVIIPPTIFSGLIFPMSSAIYSNNHININKDMGNIILSNSIGSSIGAIIAAFLLMPVFGSGKSIIVLMLIILIINLLFTFKIKLSKWLKPTLGVSTIIIIIVLLVNPKLYILPPSFLISNKKIIYYKEYTEGVLVVGESYEGYNKVLSSYINNSEVIGSNYDAVKVVKMIGHLPFMMGLECENALIVGFGMGVTTSSVAYHPEVKHIDCVELVPGLTKTAHYYSGLNNSVEKDPRLNVMKGDGRHYLSKTKNKYDLISSDPTHPLLGSGNLYTQEYFELCKSKLNKDGMVSQYLPLHKLRKEDFLGIIKTFKSVFPNSTVWMGNYHAILVGKNSDSNIDFENFVKNCIQIQDNYLYTEPYHMAANLIQNANSIDFICKDAKINTDDKSYVEFFNLKAFEEDNIYINLKYLNDNRADISESFTNIPDTALLNKYVNGNTLLNESLYGILSGDMNSAYNKLLQAIKENPEDKEFPILLNYYFPHKR